MVCCERVSKGQSRKEKGESASVTGMETDYGDLDADPCLMVRNVIARPEKGRGEWRWCEQHARCL